MKRKFVLPLLLLAIIGAYLAGALAPSNAATVFPPFQSKNIHGEDVTNAIFAENKLTMVNLWGTFCPPCIDEMPDLGNLGRSMPEGTRLVGIVLDVQDRETLDDALEIVKDAKADFLNILPVSDMNDYLRTVSAVPTTIFVDAKGNVVGEPIVGSRSEKDYRKELEKALKLVQ